MRPTRRAAGSHGGFQRLVYTSASMRVLVCVGLLLAALVAVEGVAAQAEPATADVEVTVWRRVSNPSLLYLSTRPEGGSWRTENTALDMSALSSTGRFHQSNAILVAVPLAGGGTATVEVTVWRRVSNPSLLYLSTRPEGGRWRTENTALDMSALSSTGRFHQSNAVLVSVPLPDAPPPAATCIYTEEVQRVAAATFQVRTADSSGTAFYIGSGEWITNHHVVESAATVWLLHAGTELRAQVIGTLPDYDLAMLRVQPPPSVTPLVFVAHRPDLYSQVSVVGFPSGVVGTPSATRGIVSKYAPFSLFPSIVTGEGWVLQTDAAINGGNSGGPIVDDCGRVVAVATFSLDTSLSGRDVDGIEFGIAAETVTPQFANLRSAGQRSDDTPEEQSYLATSAFCTYWSSEDLAADECHTRSSVLDTTQDHWTVWAVGVVDFDNVLYRFNGGSEMFEAGVWDALLALGAGCHELEVAEDGISTHWSSPYTFCFVEVTPGSDTTTLAAPTGVRVQKVDIPLAPDDIDVSWNVVPGATWYELWHATPGTQWVWKATVGSTRYRDTEPDWLFADHYTTRACNDAGCSAFSAVATQY